MVYGVLPTPLCCHSHSTNNNQYRYMVLAISCISKGKSAGAWPSCDLCLFPPDIINGYVFQAPAAYVHTLAAIVLAIKKK